MKVINTPGKHKQCKGQVVFFRFDVVWYGVNMVSCEEMYQQALENFRDCAEPYGTQTLNREQDNACCLALTE